MALAQAGHVRLTRAAGGLRPGLLTARFDRQRDRLDAWGHRLDAALARPAAEKRRAFEKVAARLDPGRIAEARARRAREFDALAFRFDRAGTAQLRGWRDRLAALSRTHQTLGYTETLKRGYAVVRGDGHVVGSKAAAAAAEALEIEFADGRLAVGGAPGPAAKKASPKPPPPEQGSLF